MIERTYHEVLSTFVHELLHPLLAVLTPHMRLYKQLHWTRLMSKRRSLWAKNRLQVKYIYKQRQINKWYISLKLILPSAFMCVERDGAAGVHGHRTMIFPVPIVGAGLWAPWEPLWGHVLNICCPYISRDEWRFEFSPNRHLIPSFKIVIPRMSFWCFFGVIPKITQPTSKVTN